MKRKPYENTAKYIIANADTIDWKDVFAKSSSKVLSKVVEIFPEEADWDLISMNRNLSEEFIEKYDDKLKWRFIYNWKNISKDFREKHRSKYVKDFISISVMRMRPPTLL